MMDHDPCLPQILFIPSLPIGSVLAESSGAVDGIFKDIPVDLVHSPYIPVEMYQYVGYYIT